MLEVVEPEKEPQPREPDARFTLANERTLLAWTRTSLALLAAGLGAFQLLPQTFGVDRRILALLLVAGAAVVAAAAYPQWRLVDRALRSGSSLPLSPVPGLAASAVAVVAILALVAILR
jgi:putative membrane protein